MQEMLLDSVGVLHTRGIITQVDGHLGGFPDVYKIVRRLSGNELMGIAVVSNC